MIGNERLNQIVFAGYLIATVTQHLAQDFEIIDFQTSMTISKITTWTFVGLLLVLKYQKLATSIWKSIRERPLFSIATVTIVALVLQAPGNDSTEHQSLLWGAFIVWAAVYFFGSKHFRNAMREIRGMPGDGI